MILSEVAGLCYGCSVDRLDARLTAQHGWPLLLVRSVALAPFGLAAGSLWSEQVTFDPATPQVRALIARVALCVLASFVLAALTFLPRRWRVPARRPDRPWPTWRLIAGLYSGFANLAVGAYQQAEPPAWGWHNNGWIFLLQLTFIGLFGVMLLWNARYLGRLRRFRDHGVSQAGNPR